jgi:hypothetical protein
VWAALDDVRPVPFVLIHGGATGADTHAAMWARERGIATALVRPADPTNKAEYIRRNAAIVALADYVIAFRADGKSNGTDYTIRGADAAGKLIRVVTPSVAQEK